MVRAQLEARLPELLEQVAQLLRDLHVVGQHEVARRLALAERRARHHGGRAQAHDERVAGGRGRATARITRAEPATCAAASARPPSPGIR